NAAAATPRTARGRTRKVRPIGRLPFRVAPAFTIRAGHEELGTRPRADPRRPGTQPERRRRRDPEEEARGAHRRLRLRQVLARLRHAVCGRTTPLRRVALGLRATVPRPNGEAEVRNDPRLGP